MMTQINITIWLHRVKWVKIWSLPLSAMWIIVLYLTHEEVIKLTRFPPHWSCVWGILRASVEFQAIWSFDFYFAVTLGSINFWMSCLHRLSNDLRQKDAHTFRHDETRSDQYKSQWQKLDGCNGFHEISSITHKYFITQISSKWWLFNKIILILLTCCDDHVICILTVDISFYIPKQWQSP